MNFRWKTALRPEELKGKLVLNVGCGMGRFAEVATNWGARVVGIDLSAAAKSRPRIFRPRLRRFSGRCVLSALRSREFRRHLQRRSSASHTGLRSRGQDARQVSEAGGNFAVWLYSGYNKWYRFSDFCAAHKPHEAGNFAQHPQSRGSGALQHATYPEESAACRTSRCWLVHDVFSETKRPRSRGSSIHLTGIRQVSVEAQLRGNLPLV